MRPISTLLCRRSKSLQIDVAGRAEHYTDFGDTQIGKITARYDINPQWAIRGTISTGFRAPTLAEEFYTAINVSPTSATVQLPADSAAAKILGLGHLKPEISVGLQCRHRRPSAGRPGGTWTPIASSLGNRIVASCTVTAQWFDQYPLVTDAILADGVSLTPPSPGPA